MQLYDYFRSSAAYRVRIVANLKGIELEQVPVNLVKGEQRSDTHLSRNAQGLVPTLVTNDGECLTQSLAICEYLEECFPEPALLPSDPIARARVRALCQVIACEIHPLNNLRVLKHLTGELGLSDDNKLAWYRHWVRLGFDAVEAMLDASSDFCHGDNPTLADVCLVPQVFNAERFECDLGPYPRIRAVTERARALDAFAGAAPGKQADAI
ncbi:maleylacetoacetate isomerase [Halomonas cupida]|uniref:maleylacetoacetate isomerase n=1 Tax=Halomonas cupida TaxID=44933 RepID=UPI003A905D0C